MSQAPAQLFIADSRPQTRPDDVDDPTGPTRPTLSSAPGTPTVTSGTPVDRFAAILPFRRFNRNFYRAMAGGALLANSEIAGGTYVFGICGGDYTVVCKSLNYTFLRPCYGPAVYRMKPRENLRTLVATGTEFNVVVDMDVAQQASRIGEKDKRVGRCEATFHVTPKIQHKVRALRKRPVTTPAT